MAAAVSYGIYYTGETKGPAVRMGPFLKAYSSRPILENGYIRKKAFPMMFRTSTMPIA